MKAGDTFRFRLGDDHLWMVMRVLQVVFALLAIPVLCFADEEVPQGSQSDAAGPADKADATINPARVAPNAKLPQRREVAPAAEEHRVESESAKRLAAMREIARGVKLRLGNGEDRGLLELSPEPLLRYADPPQHAMQDATVWLWRHGERPAAILKLEFYPRFDGKAIWSFCWTSVSDARLDGAFQGGKTWSAPAVNLASRWLPDAAPPSAEAQQRLRQMRQIARRFASYRVYAEQGRTELRLLSRPVYRYKDESDGIMDGAVFSIVKDTNPHVELLIEAALDGEVPRWRYACVRHCDAECHLQLDGQEVWSSPQGAVVDPRQPYFWFHLPAGEE